MATPQFKFTRARGIVWVCDIADSTKRLNDDASASSIEIFLPRLHWTARAVVEAARGQFVKWTGDGFLVWFPFELHRNLGEQAAAALNAAWQITLFVNVTNLGVQDTKPLKLRHGITCEHDALVSQISDEGIETIDLVGRGVVMAFRLAGVPASFPGVVTHDEVIDAARDFGYSKIQFARWRPSADEVLRYFKGTKRGTHKLRKSTDRKPRRISRRRTLKQAKAAVALAEGDAQAETKDELGLAFANAFIRNMITGDEWCREALREYTRFLREDLLAAVQRSIALLEDPKFDEFTQS